MEKCVIGIITGRATENTNELDRRIEADDLGKKRFDLVDSSRESRVQRTNYEGGHRFHNDNLMQFATHKWVNDGNLRNEFTFCEKKHEQLVIGNWQCVASGVLVETMHVCKGNEWRRIYHIWS